MIKLYDETLQYSETTIQSMHEREMITSMNKHKLVHHFKIHLIISLSSLTFSLPALFIQYLHQ